jgi:hypothetical protein
MRKTTLAISCIAFHASIAFAQTPQKTDLLLCGVATRSCGRYVKAHDAKSEEFGYYVSWLQGYLSAVNLHSVFVRQDIGKGKEMQSMLVRLKNHCTQRALENFSLAVLSLAAELKR